MIDGREIERLAEIELKTANEKYPLFHSQHEAYAVMKEEVEETKEALAVVEKHLEDYWHNVKQDFGGEYLLQIIKSYAIETAREAIQIAAMCDKTKQSGVQ